MNALGWRPNTRVLAYKSFLRPKMEYGLPLLVSNAKMVSRLEVTQNCVLNMVLSTARTTSRGGKLKLLQVEPMEFRCNKLQYLFFRKLDVGAPSDALSYRLWHAIKAQPERKRTKMLKAACKNELFSYAVSHTKEETDLFLLAQKLASTDKYDTIKDGRRDIAASIATPERRTLTVYTDPKFNKADQHVLTMLRVGALTFHQECARCGRQVSREHAWQCSGEEAALRTWFPREAAAHARSPDSASILFADFLANKMDRAKENNSPDYVNRVFKALSNSAKNIRDRVSGYVPSEDGRSYYHPDRYGKRFVTIRRRPPSQAEMARRHLVNQIRNRRPGRRPNRRVNFEPP
jgi:hypothetical protein